MIDLGLSIIIALVSFFTGLEVKMYQKLTEIEVKVQHLEDEVKYLNNIFIDEI